jgi:hypothetical protein
LAAIRSWRDWVDDLLVRINDDRVRERWIDLKGRLPWLEGPAGPCLFVTNRDRSLRDQLLDGVTVPVEELHALAPLFDTDASALAGLLAALQSRLLVLYHTERVSVDGAQLTRVLAQAPGRVARGAAPTPARTQDQGPGPDMCGHAARA